MGIYYFCSDDVPGQDFFVKARSRADAVRYLLDYFRSEIKPGVLKRLRGEDAKDFEDAEDGIVQIY